MSVSQVHGKSKINKSFAEEQNIDFCPALNIASVFAFGRGGAYAEAAGSLIVKRAEENGGEKSYSSTEELFIDYKSGSMHPGDLKKNAMVALTTGILEKIAASLKADKEATQATKTLKALLKKKK